MMGAIQIIRDTPSWQGTTVYIHTYMYSYTTHAYILPYYMSQDNLLGVHPHAIQKVRICTHVILTVTEFYSLFSPTRSIHTTTQSWYHWKMKKNLITRQDDNKGQLSPLKDEDYASPLLPREEINN